MSFLLDAIRFCEDNTAKFARVLVHKVLHCIQEYVIGCQSVWIIAQVLYLCSLHKILVLLLSWS